MPSISTTDLASINNAYDNYSNGLAPNTYYRFLIFHNVVHNVLGGGTWYVEGVKVFNEYEWQQARCYDATGMKIYVRSKFNNAWNAWVAK